MPILQTDLSLGGKLADAFLDLNQNVAEAVVSETPLGEGDGDPFCSLQLTKRIRPLLDVTLGRLGLGFEDPDPKIFDPQCGKDLTFARFAEPDGGRVMLLEIRGGTLAKPDKVTSRAFLALLPLFTGQAEAVYFFSDGKIHASVEVWCSLWKPAFERVGFVDGEKIKHLRDAKSSAEKANALKAFLSLDQVAALEAAEEGEGGAKAAEEVEAEAPEPLEPKESAVLAVPRPHPVTFEERAAQPITNAELDILEEILAEQAEAAPDANELYRYFIQKADIDRSWEREARGLVKDDIGITAHNLLRWAENKRVNGRNPDLTTLASLLLPVLPRLGADRASTVVAILCTRELILDHNRRERLAAAYQVPAVPVEGAAPDLGPGFDWLGPEEDGQLQGFLRPKPDLLDVGFLSRAIERAASVCRVEVRSTHKTGTGFMLGRRDRILTNYHVLTADAAGEGSIDENAKSVRVRFGALTTKSGKEADGQVFKVDSGQPIAASSPTRELDYALLRIEKKITRLELTEATVEEYPPPMRSGLHLLQHAHGDVMKLAISSEGVAGIYDDRLIQYVSQSALGSSGSPCFDDQWNVVAIHHAERSRPFGSVCEGILMRPILKDIEEKT